MVYELSFEKYRGPLDKLLELIEAKKLNITEISLAAITDDFLRYLDEFRVKEGALFRSPEGLRLLADFIVIASRLVFIKSKSLLPTLPVSGEEEAEIKDLELRLRLHKKLKDIQGELQTLWRQNTKEFARPYLLNLNEAPGIFFPGKDLTVAGLRTALGQIVALLEQYERETQTIREKIVSIEEKIQEVLGFLKEAGETTLGTISEQRSRGETIVLFLAVLHLARERLVQLEQQTPFSDIMIKNLTHMPKKT